MARKDDFDWRDAQDSLGSSDGSTSGSTKKGFTSSRKKSTKSGKKSSGAGRDDSSEGGIFGGITRRQAGAGILAALGIGGGAYALAGGEDSPSDAGVAGAGGCQKVVRFDGSELEEAGEDYDGPEEGFFQIHERYDEGDQGVVYQTGEGQWEYEDGDWSNYEIRSELGEHIYQSLDGSCE